MKISVFVLEIEYFMLLIIFKKVHKPSISRILFNKNRLKIILNRELESDVDVLHAIKYKKKTYLDKYISQCKYKIR